MSDIFISYSRDDKPWVTKLAKALEAEDYDVWWDPEILAGEDFEQVIQTALDKAKCVLTVWSPSSIKSHWVKAESRKALDASKLIPIAHKETILPMPFTEIHTTDFQGWKGKVDDNCYQQLLNAINIHVDKKLPDSPVSPKKSKRKKWLVIISLMTLLSVGGYYIWITYFQATIYEISTPKIGLIDMPNLDFEGDDKGQNRDKNWELFLSKKIAGAHYWHEIDTTVAHTGTASAYTKSIVKNPTKTGASFSRYINNVSRFKGARIRMSAFIKTINVEKYAGLYMRVDGKYNDITFSREYGNTLHTSIKGDTEWSKYEIVIDIPQENVTGIAFGLIFNGRGEAWVDDFLFETVSEKVAITTQYPRSEFPPEVTNSGINNPGFEQGTFSWSLAGSNPKSYKIGVDKNISYRGKNCAYIKSKTQEVAGDGFLMQITHDIAKLQGKRVRLSAYIKLDNIADYVSLWAAPDGNPIGGEYYEPSAIANKQDWKKIKLVFDMPEKAKDLRFGVKLKGAGKVWVDSFKLEVIEEPKELKKIQNNKSSLTQTSKEPSNSQRYIDNGDGMILDKKTELMWKKCSEGQRFDKKKNTCAGMIDSYSWNKANKQLSKGVSFASYTDWRVPNQRELRTLIWCSNGVSSREAGSKYGCSGAENKNGGYQQPTINKNVFPNTEIGRYISSITTSETDKTYYWFTPFGSGSLVGMPVGTAEGFVRLVRKYKAQ